MFIFIGGLIVCPICYWSHCTYFNFLDDKVFYLPKGTTILIAGDSHPQTSVNPVFLPHAENISSSAENYFYTFYKLKHFLAKNPQVTKVVLGFSWHNFPQNYQESFFFDSHSNVENYYLLLDEEGKSVVKSWSSSYLVPWLRYTVGLPVKLYQDQVLLSKLSGIDLSRDKIYFWGSHKLTAKSVISENMTNEKLRAYFGDGLCTSSTIMVEYLNKIMKLCSDLNITVVLLNAPVHKDYRYGVPAQAIKSFESIKSNVLTRYNNSLYVDYSDFRLPTNYYYDCDHLNMYGSENTTKLLRIILDLV